MTQWQFIWNEEHWWCHFAESHYHLAEIAFTEWAKCLEAELPLVFTLQMLLWSYREEHRPHKKPFSPSLHVHPLASPHAANRDIMESSSNAWWCHSDTIDPCNQDFAASRTLLFHQTSFSLSLCHTHAYTHTLAEKLELWGAQSVAAQFNCRQNLFSTSRLRLIAYLHYNWVYNQTINWTQHSVFITSEYPFISGFGQWLA